MQTAQPTHASQTKKPFQRATSAARAKANTVIKPKGGKKAGTSHLQKLKNAVSGRFNDEDFASHARASAQNAGCHFLFEFPAPLIDTNADTAAAILCPGDKAKGQHSLLFMAYDAEKQRIRVIEPAEAPTKIVDIAFSFARVVSYLPIREEVAAN